MPAADAYITGIGQSAVGVRLQRSPLLLTVDAQAWKLEADQIPDFFRTFGAQLPARLWELQQDLVDRLG